MKGRRWTRIDGWDWLSLKRGTRGYGTSGKGMKGTGAHADVSGRERKGN